MKNAEKVSFYDLKRGMVVISEGAIFIYWLQIFSANIL